MMWKVDGRSGQCRLRKSDWVRSSSLDTYLRQQLTRLNNFKTITHAKQNWVQQASS